MRFDVVTLFPELFVSFLATSMVGQRGVAAGALGVRMKSPREFGIGKHRSVDDTPYGGGSGMLLRVDTIVACLEALDAEAPPSAPRSHRVLLTPQGAPLRQPKVVELAARPHVALVCGRYEGFDERVRGFVDEELSLGDFVMTGGEVAAMAIIDACARLLPNVLGNEESAQHESHSPERGGLLEYPQYTRPAEFRGLTVPEVLQGGNHAAIAAWREDQARSRTSARRPDLWETFVARASSGPRKEWRVTRITLALLHHPVLDRAGETMTTAITNLDLHDMARSARTYGVEALFVVHPVAAQRLLAERIRTHWVEGSGKRRIPDRADAMELLRVVPEPRRRAR